MINILAIFFIAGLFLAGLMGVYNTIASILKSSSFDDQDESK